MNGFRSPEIRGSPFRISLDALPEQNLGNRNNAHLVLGLLPRLKLILGQSKKYTKRFKKETFGRFGEQEEVRQIIFSLMLSQDQFILQYALYTYAYIFTRTTSMRD